MDGYAHVGGDYLPLAQAAIPLVDWGFLRSDCVYDAIPFTAMRLFRLSSHLDRFWASMAAWRLACPHSQEEVRVISHELVRRSGLESGLLLVITTRGSPPSLEVRNPALFANRFYAFAQVLPPIANPERLTAGLSIKVARTPRIDERSVPATAKNFQWGDFTRGRLEAHDAGADNAVLTDAEGNLTEGPGFNIFLVRDGRLLTPARHCLKGITRATVLEIAAEQGLATEEGDFPADELPLAEEVFFSSSAGGIFPVTRVDRRPIGQGVAGPVTEVIRETYWRWRLDPRQTELVVDAPRDADA